MKLYSIVLLAFTALLSCKNNTNDPGNYAYIGAEIINPSNDYVLLFNPKDIVDTLYLDSNNRFVHKIFNLQFPDKPGYSLRPAKRFRVMAYLKAALIARATLRKFAAHSSASGSAKTTCPPISPAMTSALLAENWGCTKMMLISFWLAYSINSLS